MHSKFNTNIAYFSTFMFSVYRKMYAYIYDATLQRIHQVARHMLERLVIPRMTVSNALILRYCEAAS